MQTNTIAVIGAMECEVNKLIGLLENSHQSEDSIFAITTGNIGNKFVIVAQSGVGKVNAALHTQFIIDKYKPDCIINTGVAGGVGDDLKIGDIVIANDLVQYDVDVTALGYAKGYLCTGHDSDKPTMFETDARLIEKFERAVKTAHPEINTHVGVVATGDTFVSSVEKKKDIKELFNAMAVEMEGASIAQVTNANSVPCLVVRSISDLADGSTIESYAKFEAMMAEISSMTIATLIKSME